MKNLVLAAAAAALLGSMPLAALAQGAPMQGPPPAMQQARANARTSTMNALTPAHRAQVQSILGQVRARTLDPRDAVTKIDALLSPAEKQSVLSAQQSMRQSMQAYFQSRAQADAPQPPRHDWNGRRGPDAGRFLLMLNAPPHRWGAPPPQP